MWHDRSDLIPHADEIPDTIEAFGRWRETLNLLVDNIVTGLANHFGGDPTLTWRSASYLQMNAYSDPANKRDLLQDLHEDGHLLTVHHANAPGLEVRVDGEMVPHDPKPGEVLVMPGSVMTDLTGGAVAPLYHRVRNHRIAGRTSLMYFVNPSLQEPVYPWAGDGVGLTDLRDKIRSNPGMFGLVDVPVL